MDYFGTLEDFMLTEAVSGYEKKMASKLKACLEKYIGGVYTDRIGNVIAKIEGSDSQSPAVMAFAHIDQLGFIVRKIEPDGFIQVDRLGGIPEKVLPALNVSVATIHGEYIPGNIGVKAHHVTPAEEKYKVDIVQNLYFDIGAKNKKEVVEAGIHVGCPVCYRPRFTRLMGKRIAGTSVDNRCGCTVLAALAETLTREKPKSTVYLVGTVMEEFNLRGAVIAARKLKPDLAVCFDISTVGDTPDLHAKYDSGLSRGPVLTLYNFHSRGTLNGTIAHNPLYKHALACASKLNMEIQEHSGFGGLTDNAYVQLEGESIGCLDIGIPSRYAHSPIETCDVGDIEQAARLSHEMLIGIDKKFEIQRY
jgi:putative aminopeptidase FrvX